MQHRLPEPPPFDELPNTLLVSAAHRSAFTFLRIPQARESSQPGASGSQLILSLCQYRLSASYPFRKTTRVGPAFLEIVTGVTCTLALDQPVVKARGKLKQAVLSFLRTISRNRTLERQNQCIAPMISNTRHDDKHTGSANVEQTEQRSTQSEANQAKRCYAERGNTEQAERGR